MTTINSVTQAQALATAHAAQRPQHHRGPAQNQPAQTQPAGTKDGDGDHGIEPGGGAGSRINVKG